jgi:hypothetical protein
MIIRREKMSWWAAHAIYRFQSKRTKPSEWIYTWEDIYLIQAKNNKEAWKKARQVAKSNEDLSWGTRNERNEPQNLVLVGIRALISCSIVGHDQTKLDSGTEATYLEQVFKDEVRLKEYLKGGLVSAKIGRWITNPRSIAAARKKKGKEYWDAKEKI